MQQKRKNKNIVTSKVQTILNILTFNETNIFITNK